jgi:hypothetical protein
MNISIFMTAKSLSVSVFIYLFKYSYMFFYRTCNILNHLFYNAFIFVLYGFTKLRFRMLLKVDLKGEL